MDPRDIPFTLPDGSETTLSQLGGRAFLVVNVASKCGFTPQYAGLEELNERYGEAGLTVVGFPCNQFLGQEPGSAAEIQEFCSLNYGVTFPLAAKLRVNGARKHPLYAELRSAKDADGKAGLVKWNFEKFLVAADGSVRRFRSKTEPQDPELIAAVEAALAAE